MKSIGWAATLKETLAKYVFDETNEPEEPAEQEPNAPTYRKKCWERNRLSISIWNCFRSFM